jgi:cytochrome c-type biogenesis protein CcmH
MVFSVASCLRALARLAAVVLLATGAHAVEPGERLADPALEIRARAISAELRCLVCQNQSIDDSNAPLARDLRVLVRERLSAGSTDADVVRYIVDRYGEFVLLRPRFGLHTALLWLGPLALLAAVVGSLLKRARPSTDADLGRPLTQDEQTRLDRILSDTKPDR